MKIFISYRRADSKYVVDRIRDRLIDAYGEDAIFRDIESIPLGQNFSEVLKESTTTCDVMLVAIGPQWASVTDDKGNKRLFEPNDYTRLEVEAGLTNKNILVIPILVMGARMPFANEIPDSLANLLYRNAINVRNDPDFTPDMQRLIQGINEQVPSAAKLYTRSKKERKPMDPVTLAAAATALLTPFLSKVADKTLDKIAEQVPAKVGAVWNGIWNQIKEKPAAADAANDLVTNVEDEGNQQIFTTQLKKALEKDEEFAIQLTELVKQAKSEAGDTRAGDKIEVSAKNNSTAVGKVSIGGNVDGNFVIGNNNQVNNKK